MMSHMSDAAAEISPAVPQLTQSGGPFSVRQNTARSVMKFGCLPHARNSFREMKRVEQDDLRDENREVCRNTVCSNRPSLRGMSLPPYTKPSHSLPRTLPGKRLLLRYLVLWGPHATSAGSLPPMA